MGRYILNEAMWGINLVSFIESILRGCTKSARHVPLQHVQQSCQGFPWLCTAYQVQFDSELISDLLPIFTEFYLYFVQKIRTSAKFAFISADYIEFHINITIDPFNPYCNSYVDFLLEQCYTLLIRNELRERAYHLSPNIGLSSMDLKCNMQ